MRRRFLVLFVSLVLVGVVVALLFSDNCEPQFHGRPLSEWLLACYSPNSPKPDTAATQEATEAVRQIGTNALPCLLQWIQYEIPPWKKCANRLVSKLPLSLIHIFRDRSLIRAEAAKQGFIILGAEASPAIPELTKMVNNPKLNWTWSGERAIAALAAIGKEGLPSLVSALANPQAPNRYLVADHIRNMDQSGIDVSSAVPVLLQCLKDGDESVTREAGFVLNDLAAHPWIAVALTNNIQNPSATVRLAAVEFLGGIGEQGSFAVPALVTALNDSRFDIRSAATNALFRIAPEKSQTLLP
jgi:HEAT repeat protein